jgi:uncharacterized membrane protein
VYGDETHADSGVDSPRIPERPRRVSGDDLSRIISLSDGVFAFALTILALSLAVPTFSTAGLSAGQASAHLAHLLQQDYSAFFGYAFAFVMIALWWVSHHRIFQHVARYNGSLVWINMAFLLQIAVMPFVLSVYADYSGTQVAVDLFAGLQVTLGITISSLWDYATRAHLLKPKVAESTAKYLSHRGWYSSGVFALSIGLSFYSITAAEVAWIFVFVVQRLLDRRGPVPLA